MDTDSGHLVPYPILFGTLVGSLMTLSVTPLNVGRKTKCGGGSTVYNRNVPQKAWCLKPTFQLNVIRKWWGLRAAKSYIIEAMKEGPRPLLFLFYFTAEPQGDSPLPAQKVLVYHRPTAVQMMVPNLSSSYIITWGLCNSNRNCLPWGFYGCEKTQ